MKANAPEKIYIDVSLDSAWGMSQRSYVNEVEYTRTDAFIEKAEEWLHGFMECSHLFEYQVSESEQKETIEDFKKYMKGD